MDGSWCEQVASGKLVVAFLVSGRSASLDIQKGCETVVYIWPGNKKIGQLPNSTLLARERR